MNAINPDKVDLNLLRSLQALLRERHVGRAAKRMHVSQSAMSHTLARLRDTFDDPLFVRTAAGLEPTPRALKLAPQVSDILADIKTLLKREQFDPTQLNAHFRLQTHNFIVLAYLAPFFHHIHQKAPNLLFETLAFSDHSYRQLDRGDIDMIVAGGMQAPNRFMQRRIVQEERVCLVSKKHPAISEWGVDSFLHHAHIKNALLDESSDPVTQALKRIDLPERQIGFYADDFMVQSMVLQDSELIATLPKSLAEFSSRQYGLKILPCPIPIDEVVIKALWHERSQNDAAHSWVRERMADLVGQPSRPRRKNQNR